MGFPITPIDAVAGRIPLIASRRCVNSDGRCCQSLQSRNFNAPRLPAHPGFDNRQTLPDAPAGAAPFGSRQDCSRDVPKQGARWSSYLDGEKIWHIREVGVTRPRWPARAANRLSNTASGSGGRTVVGNHLECQRSIVERAFRVGCIFEYGLAKRRRLGQPNVATNARSKDAHIFPTIALAILCEVLLHVATDLCR